MSESIKDLKEAIDEIKPEVISNYGYLSGVLDKMRKKVYKNQIAGKEYVTFNIFDTQEWIQTIDQINKEYIVNIDILEKASRFTNNEVTGMSAREKAESYQKLIIATRNLVTVCSKCSNHI